ncbi:Abi family protein [Leptospira kanakyensis]|uniref:Abi family protein n=1 Tax=Leptospira kanakyensis TaxID=2484968 RepID=UPI00223D5693|nr:Abi family protein [Leptospira kanakyensis]MCW7468190.1 Abi family protein [Leptospira kanakyensis]
MKYTKPHLPYEKQADQLLERGLIADRAELIQKLSQVSYYRLSGYWFPFRDFPGEQFKPNTSLDEIWNRYAFDRRLRFHLLDGIERIEVYIRSRLTYEFTFQHGAFGYLEAKNFPGILPSEHHKLIVKIEKEVLRSSETFIEHFNKKYQDSHPLPPLWMVAELFSFGTMLSLLRGVNANVRKPIADDLNLDTSVLLSWIRSLNGVRNMCAHHGRIWNRQFGDKPIIPRKDNDWKTPVQIRNDRVFGILTVIKYCLNTIAPQSQWPMRFRELLDGFSNIPMNQMGFPMNWEDCPIWKI